MQGSYLISTKEYLDSVRFLGITTLEAVNELIDNSFDANADNIYIHIIEKNNEISIVVEDDGEGISAEKIDKILSFGGRLPVTHKITTGRFGWGLSSSACCQAIRTELYSKTNNTWYFSYIDLDELKILDEPIIPSSIQKDPPNNLPLLLNGSKSGTVIWFKKCDRLDYKSVNKLVSSLISNIGEVYRKYINAGKKIFVNEKEVKLVDPLMLMPGCMYSDSIGNASEFADIKPIIFDDIIDESTGKPAKITIKLSLMNLEQIRRNPDWKSQTKKLGFNMYNQGFYIMRHNRQIGRAKSLRIFTKHNNFNYFRGEISFPPALDKYFGVQTNKSRFSIDPSIRDRIQESVKGYLVQIQQNVKDWRKKVITEDNKEGIRPSEEVVAKVDKLLKRNKYDPTPEEIRQVEQEIQRKKEEEIQKVKKNPEITEEEKAEKIKKIHNRFQFYRPFERVLEFIESGNFYFPRPKGKKTEVVINTAHPFYNKIYERAIQNKLDIFIDLLIFALSKAELEFYDREDIRKFYRMQRAEWSAILSAFLDEYWEVEEDE